MKEISAKLRFGGRKERTDLIVAARGRAGQHVLVNYY